MATKPTKVKDLTHETYEEALDAALASSGLQQVDAAMVHNVRKIAQVLDEAERQYMLGVMDFPGYTKAMYLSPHFVAGLRELLMTPMARATGAKAAKPQQQSRLQKARDAERQRQGARAAA